MSSVLNASDLFQSAQRPAGSNAQGGQEDRPQAEIWLNIGVKVKVLNPDTGEQEDELLTFPVNLPLDTMRKREVPNRAPKTAKAKQFRDRAIASNQMLEQILKVASGLEPGGIMDLDGFTLQLQRVSEKIDETVGADPSDNPYLDQIMSGFGVPKKAS